jgi:hypothetical protein
VKRRMLVMALGVILALGMAAPIASAAEDSSGGHRNLSDLTAAWWNWAAQDPSPLVGNYKGGQKCDGKFVKGVFFLAGSTTVDPVKRTCTVPDDTPILFPVVNAVCSKAFPADPRPYTKCARDIIDQALVDSTTFARLDGESLRIQRIASGPFAWTIESEDNPFGVPKGTFPAASDGLWVYLAQGLPEGKHTLRFGGEFPNIDFRQDITYKLRVV